MEQARIILNNLTPCERTCLIQEFLEEYPLQARIYCCSECNVLGGEDAGKGMWPVDFYPCDECEKTYCQRCEPDLLEEGLCGKYSDRRPTKVFLGPQRQV